MAEGYTISSDGESVGVSVIGEDGKSERFNRKKTLTMGTNRFAIANGFGFYRFPASLKTEGRNGSR